MPNYRITAEMIETLSNMMWSKPDTQTVDSMIEDWLRLHPLQPVGLTATQINDLSDELSQFFEVPFCLVRNEIIKFLDANEFSDNGVNWDDAPDWANWAAQNRSGAWAWYDTEPTDEDVTWEGANRGMAVDFNKDWRDTLEQRPASKQVKPVIGQTFKHPYKRGTFVVTGFTKVLSPAWEDGVTYEHEGCSYTLQLADFIKSFIKCN